MTAILVEGLARTFDEFVAVDGISFAVEDGEIFGLLGPNGAGKTTTINMLTTLLSPTRGRATVGGADIATERDQVRQQIGVVFQEPALDTNLTARENLDFHAMMYGIPRQAREDRIAAVLGLVELDDRADDLVSEYSGGMKRRLEIARGLIQRPKVLFLDEPTLGLDAQTRRHIWEYVEALKASLGGDLITLRFEGDDAGFKNRLHEVPWVRQVGGAGQTISIVVEEGDRRVPALVAMAAAEGLEIVSVNLRQPSLEDVFLHVTGRTIREA
jgi:ABC-2 type transport system ATP-binding protein